MLLKLEKCNFHVDKVIFLGYVVTTARLAIDPKKIKAIIKWTRLINVKEV